MNLRGAWAILWGELARFFRTVFGSILSPVLTTSPISWVWNTTWRAL